MDLAKISRPTLILDTERCRRNIMRIVEKTRHQGVELRPHFKTHQSGFIGDWFREFGINKITVSSLGMAQYFARFGWKDITVAFPVNIREIDTINSLTADIQLGLLVLDQHTIDQLGKGTDKPLSVWLKIDVGTHRTGLPANSHDGIDQILERIKEYPHLQIKGFLAHAGHTYQKKGHAEVKVVYDDSLRILSALKSKYLDTYPGIKISLGDTPGASMVEDYGKVDELRPGNFVFFDLMQETIGACRLDDIAVALACPVVATHPERNQWIIYGGAVHFSKDFLPEQNGGKVYGRMVKVTNDGWSVQNAETSPYLMSLSQEHGIVQCTDETFNLCKPGDITLWLPVHSCLTADAMGAFVTTTGENVDHYRQHAFD
jgi:D-serine deaminase-like pyridoxal phosphate-dependent protein